MVRPEDRRQSLFEPDLGTLDMADSWTMGASVDCDLVANGAGVSGRHARLSFDGRVWTLEDLGSTNGTFLNGTRITGPVAVTRADTITLGHYAPMPWPPAEPAGPAPLVFRGNATVIGRDPTSGVVLDLPMISGRHARLTRDGDRVVLEDLSSANGTTVNGRPITGPTIVQDGDILGLGSYTTRLVVVPRPVPDTPPVGSAVRPEWAAGLLGVAVVLALVIVAVSGRSVASVASGISLAAVGVGLASAGYVGRPGGMVESAWRVRLMLAVGVCVAQAVLFWSIVRGMAGLVGPWEPAVALLVLASASGLALGLVVVGLVPRPAVAWGVLAFLLLPLWLFGGGPSALPRSVAPVAMISDLLPTRWAFEGLLLPESADLAETYFPVASDQMGRRADLLAVGSLLVGLAASAAYVLVASGGISRARAEP